MSDDECDGTVLLCNTYDAVWCDIIVRVSEYMVVAEVS